MVKKQLKSVRKQLSMAAIAGIAAYSLVSADAAQAVALHMSVKAGLTRDIAIISSQPISFGSIGLNSNSGIVSMDKDTGVITHSGGVVSVNSATASRGSVQFFTPRPGNVSVSHDIDVDLVNSDVANDTSSVSFSPAVDVTSHVFNGYSEVTTINVGGNLSFGTDTTEGLYEGVLAMDVNYI